MLLLAVVGWADATNSTARSSATRSQTVTYFPTTTEPTATTGTAPRTADGTTDGLAPPTTAATGLYTCAAASAYLDRYLADLEKDYGRDFDVVCSPDRARTLGHQAMTCIDVARVCPGV